MSAFVCGRPDWPFLASVFMCEWKEYSDTEQDAKDILSSLTTRPPSAAMSGTTELHEAVQACFKKQGFPHHPYVLMRDRVVKRASPSASTPGVGTRAKQRGRTGND